MLLNIVKYILFYLLILGTVFIHYMIISFIRIDNPDFLRLKK